MVIDTLQNAKKYYSLHPLFAKAFEYINSTDLVNLKVGEYCIEENKLRAIVASFNGITAEVSCKEFECHNQHIDIQVCISGVESFGWAPREKCDQPNGEYDTKTDVQLYYNSPHLFFQLREGQFVILLPNDVHAPMIGDGFIKKIIIKVKV
jgi:biofilm protein TabA